MKSPPLAWRTQAACLGMAPLFDDTIGDETRWHREAPPVREARHARAKAVCKKCPVTAECRDDTLVGRDEGVRFGLVLPPVDRSKARAS